MKYICPDNLEEKIQRLSFGDPGNEPFFELQTPITFFELEITSTMYILRERGRSEDLESVQDEVESCKEKWISTLNPFRLKMTKTIIFHKKCISERSKSNYLKQNDLERDFIQWKGSAILVGQLSAEY